MLRRIAELSIHNRLVLVFVVLLFAGLGLHAMRKLPVDAMPDVTNIQVQLLTDAPALSPTEVERIVTIPVETSMSGLPRVDQIRSVSRFGLSAVTVVFEDGTDIYFARQLVQQRLEDARARIPDAYGNPEMGPLSTGLGEVFQFEVRAEPMCARSGADTDACYTAMELRTLLDWYIAPRLRWVDGVVEVNAMGGELRTYEVQVDPERLSAFDVPLDRLVFALSANNANAGGAYLVRAGQQRLIRGEALVQSIENIERIVVQTRENGTPIVVRDLGHVHLAPMVRQGAVTRDGRGEVVTGTVMMLMGANARDVVADVREEVEELASTLPSGVEIDVFYDRADLVRRTIRTVAKNLIEGGALVVVVLLLMLGNARGGLLVASTIPLSMLGAFVMMKELDISGNLMSLGAIDFGLIVDGSVVVVESIVHALAVSQARGRQVGRVVADATGEVARPVLFGVVIIMLVYVPVLTLGGIEGRMFRPMAATVLFALGTSLVLALTLMPSMAVLLFRRGVPPTEPLLVRWIRRVYEPALRRAVAHARFVLVVAATAFAGSLAFVPFLGAEFVPSLEEGAIALQASRLPSVALEESIEATTRIERALLDHFPDEVESVVSKTGRPEIATDPMGVDLSDIYLFLYPREDWTAASSKEQLVAKMRRVLHEEVPGQAYAFSQPIELRTNELISGFRSDVAIGIYGDDLETLHRLAREVAHVVASVPGAVDVKPEPASGLPMLRFEIDRDRLARYGVPARRVLDAISAAGGLLVGEVFEGQRRFALQIRYPEHARDAPEDLLRLPVTTGDGNLVPLGELVRMVADVGPAQVSRDRIRRRITVEANVRGRDLAGFVSRARREVARNLDLPSGYWTEWRGQFENLQAASARLAVAVPVALLLIFLMLFLSQGSIRAALIIFLNVPIAATGGIVALAVRGMPFSISAGVGFIALFGIAVLNGVVLSAKIRAFRHEGLSRTDAALAGARARMRPVLMTAMTAAFGFVPMAVATSAGAEVQRPLATVVIGGIGTSTLLTLLVLPAVFARWGGAVPRSETNHAAS